MSVVQAGKGWDLAVPKRTGRKRPTADFRLAAHQGLMSELEFRFQPEDEWHGKLVAKVSAAAFAGEGGAWFNTDTLRRFAETLSEFPLRQEAPPSIASGFWNAESDALEQVHLAVSFEPHNARGAVRVTVQVATEAYHSEAEDLACSATIRFLVTYGDLARFTPEFLDLVEGRN